MRVTFELHDRRCYGAMPLITIEGIDGAGKSTLAAALARATGAELLREPGGVALSERIRELVKDPALTVSPRAEALLYAAARAQLVAERLEPALAGGGLVVLDRYVDSSLAYQGAGRGLGVEVIAAINDFATGGLAANLTLLLRLDPQTARARLGRRGDVSDRFEREPDAFFATVAAAYDALAAAAPDRFVVLDAGNDADRVLEEALAALSDRGLPSVAPRR